MGARTAAPIVASEPPSVDPFGFEASKMCGPRRTSPTMPDRGAVDAVEPRLDPGQHAVQDQRHHRERAEVAMRRSEQG